MTVAELRQLSRKQLSDAGIESADIDVKILMQAAFGWDASELIANASDPAPQTGRHIFESMLVRRMKHEPMAYIIGEQPFWSLSFKVTPDVLIPRPETEGVVECALDLIKDIKAPTIVDIGTGSGAILLSLLHEREDAIGYALDISPKALDIAALNAKQIGLTDRINFKISDFLEDFEQQVSLVVSNPPYITEKAMGELPTTVVQFEPNLALRGGNDGLQAYKAIIADLHKVLQPEGQVVFEIGYDQREAVTQLLAVNGFADIDVIKDLAGHDRVVSGKLSV